MNKPERIEGDTASIMRDMGRRACAAAAELAL